MELQLSLTCKNFLQSIQEDLPTVKLFKYRHFLSTYKEPAMSIFQRMTSYALEKKLVGEYEAIYETLKQELQRIQKYKELRKQMVQWTNPIRSQIQHAQSISNLEDMVRGYYKLAEYYRSIAMHRQACIQYNKLFRTQSGSKVVYQRSQYFSAWAQQLYFDNNWNDLSIFIRNQLQDPKLTDSTLAVIKDLKYVQLGQSTTKFFDNLLTSNYSISAIVENQVISYLDLGIIYSLVALAKKDREFLKKKTPWSSKLEVLYLKNNFRELLLKAIQLYQKIGKFHPLIDKIYNNMMTKIRARILRKYLSAYHSISLSQIQKQTSFNQGALKQCLHMSPDMPYLIDPVTQSVIYYEKSLPLYDEALQYSQLVKDKFREIVRSCITSKKTDVTESSFLQKLGGGRGLRGVFGGAKMHEDQQWD